MRAKQDSIFWFHFRLATSRKFKAHVDLSVGLQWPFLLLSAFYLFIYLLIYLYKNTWFSIKIELAQTESCKKQINRYKENHYRK